MKKALILIGVVLFLTASSLTAANFFKDVPTSHWAYDAIQKVVDAGVLKGYPGDYFKGKQTLNRYQFAMATAKVLDMVKTGGTAVGGDELNAIKSLTKEFADELAVLKNKVNGHEDRISALEKKVFGKTTVAKSEDGWGNESDNWADEEDNAKTSAEEDTWNDEETTAKSTTSALKDNKYNVLDQWYFGVTANWYQPDSYKWNNTTAGTTAQSFNSLLSSSTYVKGYLGYTWKNRWRAEIGGGKWSNDGTKTAASDANVQASFNYLVGDIDDAADADAYTNPEPYDNGGVQFAVNNAYLNTDITPIELDVSYVFPNNNPKFVPYAGIGGGSYKVKSDYGYRTATNASLLAIHTDKTITTFNLHAGFDYFLNDSFAVRLEGKYVYNDDTLTINSNDVTYDSTANGINDTLTAAEKTAIVNKYNALKDKIDLAGFQVGLGFTFFFK